MDAAAHFVKDGPAAKPDSCKNPSRTREDSSANYRQIRMPRIKVILERKCMRSSTYVMSMMPKATLSQIGEPRSGTRLRTERCLFVCSQRLL